MTIVLRRQKDTPLTTQELDGNFAELLQRIELLEQSKPVQDSLVSIKQEGDELSFTTALGHTLGRVRLPTIKLTPRGEWKTNTDYWINDLVTCAGVVYVCLGNHTSRSFDQDSSFWQKMFEISHPSPSPTVLSTTTTDLTVPSMSLPFMTTSQKLKPVFGTLAVYAEGNELELLIGDVDCWRRVRDKTEFKLAA